MICRTLFAAVLIGLALLLVGCGSFVNDLAAQGGAAAGAAAGKTAPPAAIDKLIDMDTPGNRERIAGIVRSPTAQDASRVLGNGIGRGLIDEVAAIANDATTSSESSETQPADTQPAGTRPATTQAGNATSRPSFKIGNVDVQSVMSNQIDPIVGEIARTFVFEGIKAGTGPEAQNGARAITRATSDGAMRGAIDALKEHGPILKQVIIEEFGPAIGEALRQQIKPWVEELRKQNFRNDIRSVIHEEVAPEIRQVWAQGAKDTLMIPTQPDIAPAVVVNSRNLSHGAGIGTHDAMMELGVLDNDGHFPMHVKLLIGGVVTIGSLIGIAAAASIVLLLMLIKRMWKTPTTLHA